MSLAEDDCVLASLSEYKILFVTLRHRELCGFAICHHLSGDNTGRKNIFSIQYDVEKFDKHCPRETNTYEQRDITQRYSKIYLFIMAKT